MGHDETVIARPGAVTRPASATAGRRSVDRYAALTRAFIRLYRAGSPLARVAGAMADQARPVSRTGVADA